MKALLIAPNVGGFYQDIIDELQRRGYETDYIWDAFDKDDPDFIHSSHFGEGENQKKKFLAKAKIYWQEMLNRQEYAKAYDLLFVIDGKMLHPYLFDTLRRRNSKMRSLNYLFDTTRGNYRFNVNSKYFDRVVTYDLQDAKEFGWDFMPIPWIESPKKVPNSLSFFAMGTFNQSRYELFSFIEKISKENDLRSYIKLYTQKIRFYPIKFIANLFLRRKSYISPYIYYSSLIVNKFISKDEFTKMMLESEVIVDSIDPRQDGLTARCTWALGAEKKIITNNKSIKTYDFYTPDQIYVIDDFSNKTKQDILIFMNKKFIMSDETRQKIRTFRMDNWLVSLLSNPK